MFRHTDSQTRLEFSSTFWIILIFTLSVSFFLLNVVIIRYYKVNSAKLNLREYDPRYQHKENAQQALPNDVVGARRLD